MAHSPRQLAQRQQIAGSFGPAAGLPALAPAARQRPVSSTGATLQRAALIGSSYAWDGGGTPSADPACIVNPTAAQTAVIDDKYVRKYQSRKEFDDHLAGRPVDVGLVKEKAIWYRLPFSTGFFVLGESHNVLNYRTVIKESNQSGNILGEGGTVPFQHYAQSAGTRAASTPQQQTHGTTEYAMESPVAKATYALASLDEDITRELKAAPVATASSTVVREVDFDEWSRDLAAQQPRPDVLRDGSKRPYFVDDQGERVTLQPAVQPSESGYSRGKTAVAQVKRLKTALESWQSAQPAKDKRVAYLLGKLETLAQSFAAWDQLDASKKEAVRAGILAESLAAVQSLARKEIGDSTITRNGKSGDDLIAEQHQHNKLKSALGEACTLRDVFMYEAIVNAHQAGFLMAGVGDDHRRNLEPPLTAAGIPTISYADFFSKHAEVAA